MYLLSQSSHNTHHTTDHVTCSSESEQVSPYHTEHSVFLLALSTCLLNSDFIPAATSFRF